MGNTSFTEEFTNNRLIRLIQDKEFPKFEIRLNDYNETNLCTKH